MKKPSFFVVEAAKCGTTTLYHILFQHPEIYMSPIKEPNYFCTDIKPEEFNEEFNLSEKSKNCDSDAFLRGPMTERRFGYFVRKPEDYKLLFKNVKNEKAIGEISNSYLFSKVAAQNIKAAIPDAKIIMILRNPISRIISHYKANVRDGKTILPFYEDITSNYNRNPKGWAITRSYFEMGQYADQVERYLKVFDRDKIKVLWFEDLNKDSSKIAEELFSFLGVSTDVKISPEEKQHASAEPKNKKLIYFLSQKGLKKPAIRMFRNRGASQLKICFLIKKSTFELTPEDRKKVQTFYHDDIIRLQSLLNVDLKRWLAS